MLHGCGACPKGKVALLASALCPLPRSCWACFRPACRNPVRKSAQWLDTSGCEGMRQKVARLVSELKQLVTALADEQAVRALLHEPEWRSLRNELVNFLLSLAATTWPAAKESTSETAPWLSPSVQRLQRLQQSPIRRAHVMWVLSLLMSSVSPALLSEEEINQHIAAAGRGVWWGKRCMGCYKAWQRPLTCPDCNRGKALSSRYRSPAQPSPAQPSPAQPSPAQQLAPGVYSCVLYGLSDLSCLQDALLRKRGGFGCSVRQPSPRVLPLQVRARQSSAELAAPFWRERCTLGSSAAKIDCCRPSD